MKIKRNKKASIIPNKIREIPKGPNQEKVPEARKLDEYERYYRDAVASTSAPMKMERKLPKKLSKNAPQLNADDLQCNFLFLIIF